MRQIEPPGQEEAPKDTVQLELSKEKAWGVQFVVTGQMSSVLVRSGRTERRGDQTVALPMQENGHYLLPASSLKGCIRSQAERIASYLRREDLISTLFGEEAVRGFTGTAAKLRVHECRMEQVKQETVITRTCINRFTGGVMEKRLFSQMAGQRSRAHSGGPGPPDHRPGVRHPLLCAP